MMHTESLERAGGWVGHGSGTMQDGEGRTHQKTATLNCTKRYSTGAVVACGANGSRHASPKRHPRAIVETHAWS